MVVIAFNLKLNEPLLICQVGAGQRIHQLAYPQCSHDPRIHPRVYDNLRRPSDKQCSRLWDIDLWNRYLDPSRILTGPPGQGVFNVQSEAFQIAQALMARFASDTLQLGATPVVMIVPDIHSMRRIRQGTAGIGSPLYEKCRSAGLISWDLSDAFGAPNGDVPLSSWFMPGGHYSPAGNRLVASWIEAKLRKLEKSGTPD